MTKLLYIEASPRGDESCSSQVANAFVAAYREANPDHDVEHLALFDANLPDFSAEGAGQKMAHMIDLYKGGDGLGAIGEWAGVLQEVERLKSADKVVISSPMWNFSLPYKLKHYLDLVCQPGLTFYVDDKGEYVGMLSGRPLQFVLASGSPYADRFPLETDGSKTDFLRSYLAHMANFIGFDDPQTIKIEPTGMLGPDELAALMKQKCEEAAQAAQSF